MSGDSKASDDGSFELQEYKQKTSFDLDEFLHNFRLPLLFLFAGLILIGLGVLFFRNGGSTNSNSVEVLESATASDSKGEIVVEVGGSVERPGVYKISDTARIDDLLVAAGGLSVDANREWVAKTVNRAAKLSDGQKIYIPSNDEAPNYQSDVLSANNSGDVKLDQAGLESGSGGLTNINSASQKVLEELPGIGPVYAQSIIEHRPYSSIEELLSKGALKQHVYDDVKELVAVY